MNPKAIEQARDTDLRFSCTALQRAALRAREVAQRTGTLLVVSGLSGVEKISPADAGRVQETSSSYGDDQ